MRVVTVTELHNEGDLGNYSIRTDVTATLCEDGATVVDATGAGIATFPGRCYLIVNKDTAVPDGAPASSRATFDIVPADIFDALFAFDSPVEADNAQTTDAPLGTTETPHVVHNADGTVTIDGVTYNRPAES
jgi:hypothetical protein